MRIYRSRDNERFVSVNENGYTCFTLSHGGWTPIRKDEEYHPSNPAWEPDDWDLIVGEEPTKTKPDRFWVDPYRIDLYGDDPLCGWRVVDWRASGPEQILAVYPTEVEAQRVCDTLNANANREKG